MRRLLWLLPLCLLAGCAGVQEQPPTAPVGEESEKTPSALAKEDPTRKPQAINNARMEELARTDPVAFLEESLKRYDREVRGYRTTLVKQERVDGKLLPEERVDSWFREKPFSVLMVWPKDPRPARKTLYVEGENNGKLLALPAGRLIGWLAGIQSLDPNAPAARRSSRFPITEFGIKAGSESALKAWKAARKRGDLKVVFGGEKRVAELNDRLCWELKRVGYPKPEEDGITETTYYFDKENWLQTGSILRGEDDQLIATYYFRDLKLNPDFPAGIFTRAALAK
jgi:hypothetical protein